MNDDNDNNDNYTIINTNLTTSISIYHLNQTKADTMYAHMSLLYQL